VRGELRAQYMGGLVIMAAAGAGVNDDRDALQLILPA
jgi:hypothetical protein